MNTFLQKRRRRRKRRLRPVKSCSRRRSAFPRARSFIFIELPRAAIESAENALVIKWKLCLQIFSLKIKHRGECCEAKISIFFAGGITLFAAYGFWMEPLRYCYCFKLRFFLPFRTRSFGTLSKERKQEFSSAIRSNDIVIADWQEKVESFNLSICGSVQTVDSEHLFLTKVPSGPVVPAPQNTPEAPIILSFGWLFAWILKLYIQIMPF